MPILLFDHWQELVPRIQSSTVVLFLDYDGTLVPIASRPSLAKLSRAVRQLLKELSKQKGIRTAVISGRSLKDLKQMVRVPSMIYAGNHGFELEGPRIKHVHPAAVQMSGFLKKTARKLQRVFAGARFDGLWVENKKYTLSIHYRNLNPQNIELARRLLLKEVGPLPGKSGLALTEGKKVWELRPAVEWNKGKAVLWIFAQTLAHSQGKVLPIYVGDDQTDEDAFRALKHKGISVKVTDSPEGTTSADYYVPSPAGVLELLTKIKQLKIGTYEESAE